MTGIWIRLRDSKSLPATANLLKIVEIIWPFLGAGLSLLVAHFLKLPPATIFAGLLGAISIFFIYLGSRAVRRLRRRSHKDLNRPLKILSRKSVCKVKSPELCEYELDFEVESLEDSVDVFNHKYFWTGAGSKTFISRGKDQELIQIPLASLPHDILKVILKSPMRKGAKRTIPFTLIMDGDKLPQRPYYAADVKYHGKPPYPHKLILDFSACEEVESAWKESYSSPDAEWPSEEPELVDISRVRVVEWDLPNVEG